MTHRTKAISGVIWYDPIAKTYQHGSWATYNNASQTGEEGLEFEVLYETDGISSKLASKIVRELNLASTYA